VNKFSNKSIKKFRWRLQQTNINLRLEKLFLLFRSWFASASVIKWPQRNLTGCDKIATVNISRVSIRVTECLASTGDVLDPAKQDWWLMRSGALLCQGVVVCGWVEWSSVNKWTFFLKYLALYNYGDCKRYPQLTVVTSEGLRLLPLGDIRTSYSDC